MKYSVTFCDVYTLYDFQVREFSRSITPNICLFACNIQTSLWCLILIGSVTRLRDTQQIVKDTAGCVPRRLNCGPATDWTVDSIITQAKAEQMCRRGHLAPSWILPGAGYFLAAASDIRLQVLDPLDTGSSDTSGRLGFEPWIQDAWLACCLLMLTASWNKHLPVSPTL